VEADWGAGMSDPFYDYIQTSNPSWLRHYGEFNAANSGWHFCFAGFNYTPGSKHQIYSWGFGPYDGISTLQRFSGTAGSASTHFAPSTEQFFGALGQTIKPFNNITCYSNGNNVFCTDSGNAYAISARASLGPLNPTGLGPIPQFKLDAGGFRNSFRFRNIATRIAGKDGELVSKHIAYVATSFPDALCLITSDGELWMCGKFSGVFTEIGAPTNANHELQWPTKVEFASYESPAGTQNLDNPLQFTALTFYVTPQRVTFALLGTDGKLFVWRGINDNAAATSATPSRLLEVAGFVTSTTVTNGGQDYVGINLQVVFSAPQHPNGITAQGIAHISGGSVTRVELTEPGWGYTAAPTFTVTDSYGGSTASGATGTAQIFNGQWEYLSQHQCSAIDTSGRAYFWWTDAPPDRSSPSEFIRTNGPFAPPNQDAAGYTKVAGPVLLTANGDIDTFGRRPNSTSSDEPRDYALTRLSTPLAFSDIAFCDAREAAALLTTDEDIYTYGSSGNAPEIGRGNPPATTDRAPFGKVLGSAKWTRVFSMRFGFVACRNESFDQYGNRINPIPPGLT